MRAERDIDVSDTESVLTMSLTSDCISEDDEAGSSTGSDAVVWGNNQDDFYGGSEDESSDEGLANIKSQATFISTSDCLDLWSTTNVASSESTEASPVDFSFVNRRLSRDAQSIELKALINQLIVSSAELQSKLIPLKDSVGLIPGAEHSAVMSFIEVKVQLLLNYLVNLSFYSMLKAKGLQVKDHPVIQQLTKVKTLLEKLQPVETKLKARIENILSVNDPGSITTLMPSIASFVDIEHASDDMQPKQKMSKIEKRFAPAELEALSYYREELSDKPHLVGSSMSSGSQHVDRKSKQSLIEKQEFEEDNFIRLPVAKKEKQLIKKLGKKTAFALAGVDDIDELADFGSGIVANVEEDHLGEYMNSAKQLTAKRSARVADEYVDYKAPRGHKEAHASELPQRFGDENVDHAAITQVREMRVARDQERQSKRASSDLTRLPLLDVDSSGARTAGFDIEKNKGLIRKRKKEDRNARVKNRNKFEKAVKRRKGQVQDTIRHGDDHGGRDYSGEQTGLKAYVKKSTKIT